jgi:hypothetical protein
VGERLAALPPGAFATVRVYPGPDTLAVEIRALEQVQPVAARALEPADGEDRPRRVRAAVRRIEEEFAALRPEGPVTLGQVRPEHYRYFALREMAERVRAHSVEVGEGMEIDLQRARGLPAVRAPDAPRRGLKRVRDGIPGRILREIASALDINEYLRDLVDSARAPGGVRALDVLDLQNQAALLQLVAESLRIAAPERVVLWPLGLNGRQGDFARRLRSLYRAGLRLLDLEVQEAVLDPDGRNVASRFLVVAGPHASSLLALEAGVHLDCPTHGVVEPVVVVVLPVPPEADPPAVARGWLDRRGCWVEALARGEAAVADDPLQPGPVIRIHGPRGIVDLRTGLTGEDDETGYLLWTWLTSTLPVPAKVSACPESAG